jgi:type II secretory pathway component PulF
MARLTPEQLDQLIHELASLARTGVPLPQGLAQLAATLPAGLFRESVEKLSAEVEQGAPLSRALEAMPAQVPPELSALAACGEATGDMRQLLEFALEHSRRVRRFRSALLTTMVYPVLLMCVAAASLSFVLVFIIPKIQEIFDQLGAELPAITQWMINVSRVVSGPLGIALVTVFVLLLLGSLVYRPFHDALYRFLGSMPGYRGLIALSDTAVSMKFVERMLARGVPLPATLATGALAMSLQESRNALYSMSTAAAQGQKTGAHLSPSTPAVAAWMYRQAEERGDLPATCGGIADYCEDRFERLSKRTVAVFEPFIILVVAVIVAVIVASVYLPLFNIPKIIGGMN